MSTILPGNQESAALALDGGMYGLLARRQSMMEVEPFVEKPDCIRIDFTTTTDNYSFKFGKYIGNRTSYVELDGIRVSFTTGSDNQFTVPTAGSHIVYIKPSQNWPGNWTFGFFTKCDYIRFPYNATSIIQCVVHGGNFSSKWAKVDVLDANYFSQIKVNSYGVFGRCDLIRVPVGSKQLYVNNGVSSNILDKIVEHNFKYVIPE